ncbi:MAG: D-alanyl-D-alanine carboxypeptidase [Clostridia bacterium]|nr:D-alanyl-D-alanine carboxypeptidase [Clostridia bacterium]
MKRPNPNIYIALFLIILFIFSFLTLQAFGASKAKGFSVSARSAVLYQPETGVFLFSKNAEERLPMASTTKIMTALVALENAELDEEVIIDHRAVGIEGSSAYLKPDEHLTMEELIYALLLQSANDAAVAIAYHIAGDESGFVDMMNLKADELGLTDTHFENPHGLDGDEHYTTAKELAIIAAKALENDDFYKVVSTYKKSFCSENRSRTYVNHNKLLKLYDGCIGVKTGFTKKSGRCLVGAAEKDGLTFVSVTLDAPSDWNDHKTMLDYGYENLECVHLADSFDHTYEIPILEGEKDKVCVSNTLGANVILNKGEHNVAEHLKLVRFAVAPINEGDKLGEIIYTVDGSEVARVSLNACDTVEKRKEKGLIDKILSIFKQ